MCEPWFNDIDKRPCFLEEDQDDINYLKQLQKEEKRKNIYQTIYFILNKKRNNNVTDMGLIENNDNVTLTFMFEITEYEKCNFKRRFYEEKVISKRGNLIKYIKPYLIALE